MIDYSALPDTKKPGSPAKDMLTIALLVLVMFAMVVFVASFDAIFRNVTQVVPWILVVLAVIFLSFIAGAYVQSSRNTRRYRRDIAAFAAANNWQYHLITDRTTLPPGLPAGVYETRQSFAVWHKLPPAMILDGTVNTQPVHLVFVMTEGMTFFANGVFMRWPVYTTFYGTLTAQGEWSYQPQEGYVVTRQNMQNLLEPSAAPNSAKEL